MRRPNPLNILVQETRCELLKLVRMPAFMLPTLSFPLLFYSLFGIALNFGSGSVGSVSQSGYMLVTYGAFGVIGAALFALGTGLANERGQGWMLFKRATPMPPLVHFLARVAVATVIGLLIVMLLMVLGAVFGGVRLPTATWVTLAAVLTAGAVPFSLFGMALGYLAGPNSAPAIINLIYLPISFASGLWMPVFVLPRFFQELAVWLPPYHYAQLALATVGAAQEEQVAYSVGFLVVCSVIFLAVALWGYRRDQGVTYG